MKIFCYDPNMRPKAARDTPLSQLISAGRPSRRAGPSDALALARKAFLQTSHLDMQALAQALGVNRVTLYRWVGNQELLLGEVLWSLALPAWQAARQAAPGQGAAAVANAIHHFLQIIRSFVPVQRFLAADPEYALRVLTSKHSVLQERVMNAFRDLLAEQTQSGQLQLPPDLDSLAYALVRLGEGYLYNDLITGHEPDLAKARMLIWALLRAPWQELE
jgi:AcrR family transcriptional regulator